MSHTPSSDWAMARLGDVISTAKGKKPKTLTPQERPGYLPYIDISAVERGTKREWADPSESRVVPTGSLVMVWDGARSGWVGRTRFQGALGSTLAAIDTTIDTEYLETVLRSQFHEINGNPRGSGIPHVNPDFLKSIEIAVPPIAMQREIAALSSAIDNTRISATAHLNSARCVIDRFRQAVLAAACAGRLTADWREDNEPNPAETAVEARRNAERLRLGKRYREPFRPDIDSLPGIPDRWTWAALPELGELGRGKSRHRPRNDPKLHGGDYPFIQTGDVARSGGRITSHTQTYNDVGLAQSRLWPKRTVCITIAANIADSGLLTYPAAFPDSVVGLVADESVALPEYVELFIRTARRDLAAFAPATAQANINLAILSEVAVALPPVEEQSEIVRRADELFAFADTVAERLDTAGRRIDLTSQAVLAKAFRGELPTERPQSLATDRQPAS